jgi:putative NADH-flavin reductase
VKKIIVFGATGGTGKQVVAQALQAGHEVSVVIRNPDAFTIQHKNLEMIKGNVFETITFSNTLKGKDSVISCLGVQHKKPTKVYSEGIKNIMQAMQKENISRIICLSAGAVIVPPNSSLLLKFITKNVLQRLFRHMYADMLLMEEILRKTDLNWTGVRPPWLRNTQETGKYRIAIHEHLSNPSKISRADLAHFIVKHLDDEKTFKALVEISY